MKQHTPIKTLAALAAVFIAVSASSAKPELDPQREARAREMVDAAIFYLRTQQDPETGGWVGDARRREGFELPAVSALALTGMLMDSRLDHTDPSIRRGVAYVTGFAQADGGIYDRILPNYNTSIVLSMLAQVDTDEARALIGPAQDFLRRLQWSEQSFVRGERAPERVGRDHPFYGGVGYGRHGRPDLSNLAVMLQGLHDSGVPADDPAFERALVFLSRVQMVDSVNDMHYADGSNQGGFIYATGPDAAHAGVGQSFAGMVTETMDDGTRVSRLRAYGSMSYSGFKSLIYAGLTRDDPRVQAVLGWISEHYDLNENPGLGMEGFYYYIVAFSRSMDALGEPVILTSTGERNWAADLVDRLAGLQASDGSFEVHDERWLENDRVLVTAYCLIALQQVLDDGGEEADQKRNDD